MNERYSILRSLFVLVKKILRRHSAVHPTLFSAPEGVRGETPQDDLKWDVIYNSLKNPPYFCGEKT